MTDKNDLSNFDGQQPEERLAAILGLIADNAEPIGPAPDLKEIQDWHLGKLEESRATEVKTHVARNPACFQLWADIMAAETAIESEIAVEESIFQKLINRIKQWRANTSRMWVEGGLATAVAVMLVIIVVPFDRDGWSPDDNPIVSGIEYDWPYLSLSTSRGGELTHQQKTALKSGLRQGLQLTTQGKQGWQVAIDSLPKSSISCDKEVNKDGCERESDLLKKVGLHASVLYLACLEYEHDQLASFDDMFWSEQTQAWKDIAERMQHENIKALQEAVSVLSNQATKDQQCESVREVIYLSH